MTRSSKKKPRIMCKFPSVVKQAIPNLMTRFHTFFAQIENFREPHFLFLSTRGIEASKGRRDISNHTQLSRKQKREQYAQNKSNERNEEAAAAASAESTLLKLAETSTEEKLAEAVENKPATS
jgi:hypothetical protein